MLDLMQFKAAEYDLGKIAEALKVAHPGQEALGQGRKAVSRLRDILSQVGEAPLGRFGDLDTIARCLDQQKRPAGGMFDPHEPPALSYAREAYRRVADYFKGLRMARFVCALDQGAADRAAGMVG